MKTILSMVQTVERELGLTAGTTVFGGAATKTDTQLGAMANRCIDELRRMNRWTAMQFEYDFQVAVPLTTTGTMAAASSVITGIPSTTTLSANNFQVAGAGIPNAARVVSVDSPTQVTMSMINTNDATVTGTSLVFSKDTYPIPADFDFFNNRTFWDRTNFWELIGPESPQDDQYRRSGIVATGPRRRYRKLGPYANTFRIWPPPTEIVEPIQLVFEYMSLNAVALLGSPTVFGQYFINDTDVPLLDDQAIILGMKWMFWEIKGMNFIPMQNRWVDYCDRLAARDGAAPTLNWVKGEPTYLLSSDNVQDGNYPSS